MLDTFKHIARSVLLPDKRLIILTWHQVSEDFDPKFNHKNIWLSSGIFEKQLIQLKNNYSVLPLRNALENLKTGNIKEPTFVLTFDDGDKTVKTNIVPLLEKYNLPATFFINSAYLGTNQGYWFTINNFLQNDPVLKENLDKNYLNAAENIRRTKNPEEYLNFRRIIEEKNALIPKEVKFTVSYDFLKSLNKDLFSVGLHGHEHQRFSMMPVTWKRENIVRNIEALKTLPGYIPGFAIPFGGPDDWDRETVSIAKEYNLAVFLAVKGYNTKYNDILLRDAMTGDDPEKFLKDQSPFKKKYLKLNGIIK
jgi:peptidoglycan/xylan/chitin deacetylase (PgdA/CDA1 family)